MSLTFYPPPNNLTELAALVMQKMAPQLEGCQRALYYSQAVIGDYKSCARNDDHLGWLVCDGRLVNREEHNALFEVVGTSFGSTDSTNFRLPDLRGRVFGGLNQSGNRNNTFSERNLGSATGAETHTLTIGEMPSHNHAITDPSHAHNITDPSHAHNITDPGHVHSGDTYRIGTQTVNDIAGGDTAADEGVANDDVDSATTGITVNNATTGVTVNNNTTGITINNRGGDLAHNNMQPTLFAGNIYIFAGVPANPPSSDE
jgi:microcystin-dependent protein